MTIGRVVQLERQDRMSKVILREVDPRPVSKDIDFIMKVALLGLVQGFCDKMLEDACRIIMESDLTYKKKRKDV